MFNILINTPLYANEDMQSMDRLNISISIESRYNTFAM